MQENGMIPDTDMGPKLSLSSKLWLIFTNPSTVFKNLAVYPDWIMPALIIVVLSIVSAFLVKDFAIEAQKNRFSNSERFTEEQKNVLIEKMEQQAESPIQMVMMIIGSIVYVIASITFAAALFLFTGNVILGGSSDYRTMLAVYAWGFLVAIPETLIKIPMVLAKKSIHVYTSLAVLFDPSEAQTIVFKLANAIDIFALWRVTLWAIGFGIVYKFSNGKSYTVIGVWYIIWILISIAVSTLAERLIA
jgi:hypothetical protein